MVASVDAEVKARLSARSAYHPGAPGRTAHLR